METGVHQPAPADYMALQYLDRWAGGRLFGILNDTGARGLSVCPVCKIGDFGHVDGCRLDLNEEDMSKIQNPRCLKHAN